MKYLLGIIISILTVVVEAQSRYSVIITEIMADPSPSAGLPSYEWIEIKNISPTPVDLKGWKIGDETGISGSLNSYILLPDSFLIITTSGGLPTLSRYGPAISVSNFPSLDNDTDLIFIQNSSGRVIHGVSYSIEWYKNALKQEGGWTLEMINTNYSCLQEENWQASNADIGGTPGTTNSTTSKIPETILPKFQRVYAESPDTIIAVFDRPIDSLNASIPLNYILPTGMTVINCFSNPPLFNSIKIVLSKPMEKLKTYLIEMKNMKDCLGRNLQQAIHIKAGIAEEPDFNDCIINEVLFDPLPGGVDFVEIYNKSNKIVDLSRIALANRNTAGLVSSIQTISSKPFYFFPGELYALTESPANISMLFQVQDPNRIKMVNPMPSMPDETGNILLLNFQGKILDELKYYSSWHFKLLQNFQGISLERLDKNGLTQLQSNWHSASSTSKYGTPGYENSQTLIQGIEKNVIAVSPKVFSPDMDGWDDVAKIDYNVSSIGNVANAWIYNEAGICVKYLIRNATVSSSGYWIWDGLDDKGRLLEPGNYILLVEFFNLEAKKSRHKVLLAIGKSF